MRAPDLRFSLEETRELLEAAGIALSEAAWSCCTSAPRAGRPALRMAVISLIEHPDPERFVAEFSGSERTVAGYLLAEVLERQPAEVRELLLRTSILERVNGPLADFLTGGSGSERILQSLEDANAFVILARRGPVVVSLPPPIRRPAATGAATPSRETIDELHRAAAQWYEQHGYLVEAIRHAQAAGEWTHAIRVLADNCIDLVLDGRKATVRLLAAFPAGAAEADAELALAFATARAYDGLLEEPGQHRRRGAAGRDGSGRPATAVRAADSEREAVAGVPARRSRHRKAGDAVLPTREPQASSRCATTIAPRR